jgi:hypothetical protein
MDLPDYYIPLTLAFLFLAFAIRLFIDGNDEGPTSAA